MISDRERVLKLNVRPVRREGAFVLYWMIAARRPSWNFALDRAVEWARELGLPILVLEPLRVGYHWASDRLHGFVAEGMADNARSFARAGIGYYPYVEPAAGAGSGLLESLAKQAAVIVTDDYPAFFLPRMVRAAAARAGVSFEAVDSNGLVPMRAAGRAFPTAFQFRRYVHQALPRYLTTFPSRLPFRGARLRSMGDLPSGIMRRWPAADLPGLIAPRGLAPFPIDHAVAPVAGIPGGVVAGRRALRKFLAKRYERYAEDRNDPDADATSGLAPYLHFGHLSVHEVVSEIFEREEWSPARIREDRRGRREGWWGLSGTGESFLDELVTWRELGFNTCVVDPEYDRFGSLPEWARRTLAEHAADPRSSVYALAEFEAAETHDPLWNAAQRQLVTEGRIHGYLRMLWGKKILEWSESPEAAFDIMVELNNKYALDGRDPNSYSGISWVLGRYDRPWGPERPVFGKVRYMSSENTARKVGVRRYLERYGPQGGRTVGS
ncbi:MAG: deoxyribodipyrimidine photolyase [Gemmatimonadales bacterium]|nr:deoxyribodipyrimidine photolyase [Gemmatimonadales bacterium]